MRRLLLASVALISLHTVANAQGYFPLGAPQPLPGVNYLGDGDVVSQYTTTANAAWVGISCLKRSYQGTQMSVNITSTSSSDTCDVECATTATNGVTANCGVGGNDGKRPFGGGSPFCSSGTDCVVNTGYNQDPSSTAGNFTPVGGTVNLAASLNGLPCMAFGAASRLSSANAITPATGVVSLGAVFVIGSSNANNDWIVNEQNNNNRITSAIASSGTITLMGGTSGSISGTGFAAGTAHAANGAIDGSSSSLNIDGSAQTPSSVVGSTTSNNALLGYNGGGSDTSCVGQGGFIDNFDFSSSETGLHNAQSAFWGTP